MQIKINLKIFLFVILFIITHQIEVYSIFMMFGVIHEFGHLATGLILKLKPKKITIMPLGLSIIFEEFTSIKKVNLKKMIIAIAGPMTNFAIIAILLLIHKEGTEKLIYANIIIAIFNLLPIYPLDGGRIVKCALKMKFEIKKSEEISYILTNSVLIILTIVGSILTLSIKNITCALIIFYLWGLVIKENKKYELKRRVYELLES